MAQAIKGLIGLIGFIDRVRHCTLYITSLHSSFSVVSSTTTNTTMCCDPALIQASYGVPIAWLVFEVLVMLGTSLKFVISF